MSERYEISDQGDGTAIVIDTHTDQPVYTADGTRVYEAPNPAALLHVMAHSEPADADGTPIDYDGTPIAPAPVVRPVEKVDYPTLAGSAIGTVSVLLTPLNGLMRWMDRADSVSPEFWMDFMRDLITEARTYAADAAEEFSTR